MKAESLCMGCMANKGKAAVCPQCGWSDGGPGNTQQLPPHTVLAGKYVIGRALGQGGFGITYLACDLEKKQRLAIKEYFPVQFSTRAQDRLTVSPISAKNRPDLEYGLRKFAEEAAALSRFKEHPGIVHIVDFLNANGTAYIVMEYVEGRDLKQYLDDHGGKIPFEAALKILLPTMSALEDVHRARILHRDISPDNIYIEATGGVKILDFGATRYAIGEQSRTLSVVLKPGYAPEEQYHGKGIQGEWTDIYALGATFYRALTGRVPPEALDRLVEDDLVPPSDRGIAIPAPAEAALLKALAVKAANRFQTVAEFREAVLAKRIVQRPTPDSKPLPQPVRSPERIPQRVAPAVRLPKVFLLVAAAILFLVMLVGVSSEDTMWILLPTLPLLFALMVYLFAQMWRSIQDGQAKVTPETGVALCFIPLFNLYWAFPVFWGFAKEYNRFLDRHQQTRGRLNETLFLLCSLAYVVGWVATFVGRAPAVVLVLVNAALLLPALAMICDAVNDLAKLSLQQPAARSNPFSLYCVSGDFQGKSLDVDSSGMIIGRNRAQAHVVLSSDDISGRHARVWQDPANAGVWIEDMNSTNGTFFRRRQPGSQAEWVRLVGSRLLRPGDHFRLSGDAAEFEVKSA